MDRQEFDEFFAGSYARITAQVYAMIGSRDEAEECVQEAFVRAWHHRGQLDHVRHPEAWVRTTAYRLAVSRWRRVVRARRAPDRALSPAGHTPGVSETHVALVAALRQLPEAQRRTLVLHHIADLSVEEVAAELSIPVGTVKTRLRRGRATLATLLADANPTEATAEGAHHG
ncbi:MAG TPA: sigma-70 family RNA polymerase sigma factor [Nocardioidaceae bacterium]|nr:sigma-70 family RNA polymerase sigma factor [Nocardioidaceae bacterium]